MRKSSTAACILLALLTIVSCGNAGRNPLFAQLAQLTVVLPAEEGRILSPVAGTLVDLPAALVREAALGRHVAMETTVEYRFASKVETTRYVTVIGNLEKTTLKKGAVEKGSDIGTAREGQAFMLVMAEGLDSYLVCSATKRPENRLDRWWYSGEFLLDTPDSLWLNYLNETSAATALAQMLAGGKTNRYLLNLELSGHPVPIPADMAVELTAYDENRTGLDGVESMHTFKDGDKTVVIFWPPDFSGYLRDEYVPGRPIWIFSKVIPCDTDYRKVYVFAREFLLEPLESLYASRLESYRQ